MPVSSFEIAPGGAFFFHCVEKAILIWKIVQFTGLTSDCQWCFGFRYALIDLLLINGSLPSLRYVLTLSYSNGYWMRDIVALHAICSSFVSSWNTIDDAVETVANPSNFNSSPFIHSVSYAY